MEMSGRGMQVLAARISRCVPTRFKLVSRVTNTIFRSNIASTRVMRKARQVPHSRNIVCPYHRSRT